MSRHVLFLIPFFLVIIFCVAPLAYIDHKNSLPRVPDLPRGAIKQEGYGKYCGGGLSDCTYGALYFVNADPNTAVKFYLDLGADCLDIDGVFQCSKFYENGEINSYVVNIARGASNNSSGSYIDIEVFWDQYTIFKFFGDMYKEILG